MVIRARMLTDVRTAGTLGQTIRKGEEVNATYAGNLPSDSPFTFYVETPDGRSCAVYATDVQLDEGEVK